jgi:hypothetical protein
LLPKKEEEEEEEEKEKKKTTRVHGPSFNWGIFSRLEYESLLSISDIYNT